MNDADHQIIQGKSDANKIEKRSNSFTSMNVIKLKNQNTGQSHIKMRNSSVPNYYLNIIVFCLVSLLLNLGNLVYLVNVEICGSLLELKLG